MWAPYPATLPRPDNGKYSYTRLSAINHCLARGGTPPELTRELSSTNESALLGIVAHRFLEQNQSGSDEKDRSKLWDEICIDITKKAQEKAILQIPNPRLWPGYEVKRSAALAGMLSPKRFIGTAIPRNQKWQHELYMEYSAASLFGIADLVRTTDGIIDAIYDLKTGTNVETISSAFRIQLGLYGYLATSSLGAKIKELGIILMDGSRMLVDDVESAMIEARDWAFVLIEKYKAHNLTWATLFREANPSVDACRGCALRPVCPSFQGNVEAAKSTGFCAGRVVETGRAKNGMGFMTIRSESSGAKIHISQLVALPEAGANIAIFDARWLSETSVQLQWNSRIVMLDDYATLPGQAR